MNKPKYQLAAIDFILGLSIAVSLGYTFNDGLRHFISSQGIDATVVIGLVTLVALLATVRHNFSLLEQYRKDRNFAYRLSVKSKFEEMGVTVIAKLLEIESRRVVCMSTLENIKLCLASGKVYVDGNNVTSTDVFNADSCNASAALDVYFPDQGEKWNEVLTSLNAMGTLASSIMLTYSKNDNGQIPTQLLADIDNQIKEMQRLNDLIGDKPQEIRDAVVEHINTHTLNLTKF